MSFVVYILYTSLCGQFANVLLVIYVCTVMHCLFSEMFILQCHTRNELF